MYSGVTEAVRSPAATLFIWAVCGIENILGALMYAELFLIITIITFIILY